MITLVAAQINVLVGDALGNAAKVIDYCRQAIDQFKADCIVFPEMTLSGYPPEDLVFRADFLQQCQQALKKIQQALLPTTIIVGYPVLINQQIFNQAAVIQDGQIIATYNKRILPNYAVFDEKRYFSQGESNCVFSLKGINIGVLICEDLWFSEPINRTVQNGANLIVTLNASPFDYNKAKIRQKILAERVYETHCPILYVNLIGGQDELVFDGGSMIMDQHGQICRQAPYFKEDLLRIEVAIDSQQNITIACKSIPSAVPEQQNTAPDEGIARGSRAERSPPSLLNPSFAGIQYQNQEAAPAEAGAAEERNIYQALVLGLRDYIKKNRFPGAVIGLSGGIDSALTLAIAVDAMGKEQVCTLMMPSRFTSELSIREALNQTKLLDVRHNVLEIEPIFAAYLQCLSQPFAGLAPDTTEENLQARIRGALLMAFSNKKGLILLTTGNKSEMSVGYATLYGDMAGGFAVLKDVTKTMVYRLANYRNSISPAIPQAVIERPPSAELAAGQLDQDSLPPYSVLDEILVRYIELDQSVAQISETGIDAGTIEKVIKMINRNEYKRRQAPPGIRITQRAFGKDRRYPITSGFNA
ncbi:MAG: NAD+ synthase [Proteobacteria bacterium]|nr:NAD+ synthase [Pseudomonadota bacterium]